METSPTPPKFDLTYNVTAPDIGGAFTKGMTAGQAAGEPVAKGISTVFDVMTRNRTADDTLTAMNKTGMLSNDAYQAVANKSLGAKESMLGMYAGQWIAQQAQNRELQKAGYQGNVEIAVDHAKLLDTFSMQRGKFGVTPNNQSGGNQAGSTQVVPMQPLTGKTAPPLQTNLSGTTAAPKPLGTDVSNPQLVTSPQLAASEAQKQQQQVTVGAPIGSKEVIPPGARVGTLRGQRGVMSSDGTTFRPFSQ